VAEEALRAWSEVLAAARDLQFPAQVLEASTEGALLLLQRGEKLGARSRMCKPAAGLARHLQTDWRDK
jgi:hypothetical protein